MDALATPPVTGGGGERERHRAIKCMRSHTPAKVERRESHRANQVYGLTTHSYSGEERVIEPIKCMRSPHTSYRWRGESHRENQVFALTTHQLEVERRERESLEPIKCMRSPHHQLQVERRRESYSQSSVCARHTPATGGEERARH